MYYFLKFIFGIKLYMFRTVSLSIIRRFSLYTQQWYVSYRSADRLLSTNLYVLLCLQLKTPDDGQRNCPKHVEFYSKNKFEKLVHLVGFIIRIYHDARSTERQNHFIDTWTYNWRIFSGILLCKTYTELCRVLGFRFDYISCTYSLVVDWLCKERRQYIYIYIDYFIYICVYIYKCISWYQYIINNKVYTDVIVFICVVCVKQWCRVF